MLNPIEKFKFTILHLNRDWNHCNHLRTGCLAPALQGHTTKAVAIQFTAVCIALEK